MLRVLFFGTAELACASLTALAGSGFAQVIAVVTQPDRPKGRDLKLQPSPVKAEALRLNLPVLQPEKARHPDFVQTLRTWRPDLIVVAAYGQILPNSILEIPPHGCLNVHTSLLPKYRGAAPIQWAIFDGEPETGVTIMKMDAGLDTGDILTQRTTPILPTDNGQTLHDRLARIGAELLLETIPPYTEGKIAGQKQPSEGATYARKITKEDGRLDWTKPAHTLWNQIRAFTPWPGAFCFLPADGPRRLLKLGEVEVVMGTAGQPGEIRSADKSGIVVACGENGLRILSLQREGAKKLDARQFLVGTPLAAGLRLE